MDWRCADCGEPHPSEDPPCHVCGHDTFEHAEDQTLGGQVWVCTQCGRQHQRHNPPCSSCGTHDLELRELADLDDPLTSPDTRWVDVVEPRYVAGYVVVGLLLGVLALGFAGIVPVPGLGPEPVPGNATSVAGQDLATVEESFVADAESARGGSLTRSRELDDFAREANQQHARAATGQGDRPNLERLAGDYDFECDGAVSVAHVRASYATESPDTVDAYANESAVAADLYDRFAERQLSEERQTASRIGVDVHALDDQRLLLFVAIC
jgi:hypothetical protein